MLEGRSETLTSTQARRTLSRLTKGHRHRTSGHAKLSRKVDSMYEDALETLSALLLGNPTLQMYLDRHFDLNAKAGTEDFSADKGGVPRIQFDVEDTNDIKESVLQSAIEQSSTPHATKTLSEVDTDKLKMMMKALKNK